MRLVIEVADRYRNEVAGRVEYLDRGGDAFLVECFSDEWIPILDLKVVGEGGK